MNGAAAIDALEQYLDALESALSLTDGDPDDLVIEPPQLVGRLDRADLERATAALERLEAVQQRAAGQRTRLGGELADLRRRRNATTIRRGPQAFDTSM